jgi:hypothetical protein
LTESRVLYMSSRFGDESWQRRSVELKDINDQATIDVHSLICGITFRLSIAVSRISGRGAQETHSKTLTLHSASSCRTP